MSQKVGVDRAFVMRMGRGIRGGGAQGECESQRERRPARLGLGRASKGPSPAGTTGAQAGRLLPDPPTCMLLL